LLPGQPRLCRGAARRHCGHPRGHGARGFVGRLVFKQRIPTTPHATVGPWLDSRDRLAALNLRTVVPSCGPVHADASGIDQTRRFLQWLDRSFGGWAAQGWDMNEVLRGPVPCSGASCGATWVSGIGAVAETRDSLVGAPAA
jgi:hypothetical protein